MRASPPQLRYTTIYYWVLPSIVSFNQSNMTLQSPFPPLFIPINQIYLHIRPPDPIRSNPIRSNHFRQAGGSSQEPVARSFVN